MESEIERSVYGGAGQWDKHHSGGLQSHFHPRVRSSWRCNLEGRREQLSLVICVLTTAMVNVLLFALAQLVTSCRTTCALYQGLLGNCAAHRSFRCKQCWATLAYSLVVTVAQVQLQPRTLQDCVDCWLSSYTVPWFHPTLDTLSQRHDSPQPS